jgi:invasion protein IalB
MTYLIRSLPLALMLALSGPAFAQETPAAPEAETPADPLALNMGENEPAAEDGPGSIYVKSTHDDWEIRCIRAPEGSEDPCQLYQLLRDSQGNAVSEINIFPLDDTQEAAAGATVVTPLETLLTAQLGMQVDSGGVKRYPFAWCSQIGCFARLGFADEDVAAFKRGNEAKIIIVPVAAPDQQVALTVSLKGFTAAFDEASTLRN